MQNRIAAKLTSPESKMITPGYNMSANITSWTSVKMGHKTYNLARQLTLLTVQQKQVQLSVHLQPFIYWDLLLFYTL